LRRSRNPAKVTDMARPLLPLPRVVPLGRVIATRRFRLHRQPGTIVELRIGTPREMDQAAYCPVQLVGLGDEKVRRIFGVDTFQALQLAFHYLEPMLLQYGGRLRWYNEPAHKSLATDASSLFDDAGLSEFLLKFAALCAEHSTLRQPAPPPAKRPRRKTKRP
jgi:hypothetical protein